MAELDPMNLANTTKLGAVQFIENLDRTTLTISDEDFEKNVEAAVSAIAEKHQAQVIEKPSQPEFSGKSTSLRSDATTRLSSEAESSTPRKSTSSNEYDSSDPADEKAAMSGLLRTIQRPLSSIGRIFSEDVPSQSDPARTPLPGNTPRMTPSPRVSTDGPPPPSTNRPRNSQESNARGRMTAEEAAARQSSAEVAEAQRIQRAEHSNIVETLAGMFPDLDREIISDVVTQKEGR